MPGARALAWLGAHQRDSDHAGRGQKRGALMSARDIFERLTSDQAQGWALLEQWKKDDRQEDEQLEFKSGIGEDGRQLAKALSGFANSDGGVIVFGVQGVQSKGEKRERVVQIGLLLDAEASAGHVLASYRILATPSVPRVRVRAVCKPGEKAGVVAVLIPASDRGPHRAEGRGEKGRYFIRTASSTELMPHSLLGALFGQRPSPRLRLRITRGGTEVRFSVLNEGRGSARDILLTLDLGPTSCRLKQKKALSSFVTFVSREIRILHPEQEVEFRYDVEGIGGFDTAPIAGRLYCADAPPVEIGGEIPGHPGEILLPYEDN